MPSTAASQTYKPDYSDDDHDVTFTHYDKNFGNFNVRRSPNRFVDIISNFLCGCCSRDHNYTHLEENGMSKFPLATI
jgi:hypothetical protein